MAVDRTNLMEALKQPATTNAYPKGRTAYQWANRANIQDKFRQLSTGGGGAKFNTGLEGAG